jgi:hypothetical protein
MRFFLWRDPRCTPFPSFIESPFNPISQLFDLNNGGKQILSRDLQAWSGERRIWVTAEGTSQKRIFANC